MKKKKVSCREGDFSRKPPKAHCHFWALLPYQAHPLFAMLLPMNLTKKWGATMAVLILALVHVGGNVPLGVPEVVPAAVLEVVKEDAVAPVL